MTTPRREVAELLARAVAAGMVPGAVACWGDRRDLATVVVGRSAVSPPRGPAVARRDTLYDLASLTKPLATGLLLVLARREQRIDLDWTVGRLLPETRGRPVADISVAELATHTSGLPAWIPLYAVVAEEGGGAALRGLAELPLTGRPAPPVTYSCAGYLLLGMMLERAFGTSLDQAFLERVSRPLGVETEIGFRPSPEDRRLAGCAHAPAAERALTRECGHDPEAVPPDADHLPDDGNARFLGGVAGNAGLFGTARAVLEIARQFLQPPPGDGLLSREEIAWATASRTDGGTQQRGLAWQLGATPGCSAGPALPPSAFGHTGFTGTSVWVDPVAGQVMVLLTNRHHPAHRGIDLHPLRRRYHAVVGRFSA